VRVSFVRLYLLVPFTPVHRFRFISCIPSPITTPHGGILTAFARDVVEGWLLDLLLRQSQVDSNTKRRSLLPCSRSTVRAAARAVARIVARVRVSGDVAAALLPQVRRHLALPLGAHLLRVENSAIVVPGRRGVTLGVGADRAAAADAGDEVFAAVALAHALGVAGVLVVTRTGEEGVVEARRAGRVEGDGAEDLVERLGGRDEQAGDQRDGSDEANHGEVKGR